MGWFWADSEASSRPHAVPLPHDKNAVPPPGCPMHQQSAEAMKPKPPAECPMHQQSATAMKAKPAPPSSEACPYVPPTAAAPKEKEASGILTKLNPLNYMFSDLSQSPAENQSFALPTDREPSTIPKGEGGNWEYPSPQQMYNALLRKGYEDTDPTAVEAMVSVHNFLNEGAWAEVTEWERRFARGLSTGWEMCKRGEAGSMASATLGANVDEVPQPKLLRFQGRPKDMTPKAAMWQMMGMLSDKFKTEPPFDRHDWYVQREYNGRQEQIRYVIDYYDAGEEDGEPVFHLDVRPAVDSPKLAVERLMRWSGDIWYRATGASLKED